MKFVIHNVKCLILIQWKSSFILFQVKEEDEEEEEEKKDHVNNAKPITISLFCHCDLLFLNHIHSAFGPLRCDERIQCVLMYLRLIKIFCSQTSRLVQGSVIITVSVRLCNLHTNHMHSCLSHYSFIIKFSQSVIQSVSVCLCLPVCQPASLSLSLSLSLFLHLSLPPSPLSLSDRVPKQGFVPRPLSLRKIFQTVQKVCSPL